MTSDSQRTHWRLACVGIATLRLLELALTRAANWWQSEDMHVSSRPDDPMPVESREGQAAAGFRRQQDGVLLVASPPSPSQSTKLVK